MEKNTDEYIEKLSKKDPMIMERFELEDWLDHCIYDKMEHHTFTQVQRDTFEHLLYYFRMLHFELHKIEAVADNAKYLIRSLLICIKEKNPEMVDIVLEMAQKMNEEQNMRLVQDETPEDAQRIIDEANALRSKLEGVK